MKSTTPYSSDRRARPRPTERNLARRLRIATPLAVGAALVGLFIALLVKNWHDSPRVEAPATPEVVQPPLARRTVPVPMTEIPHRPPDRAAERKAPPLPASPKRWKIEPLPEGWDPRLAEKIAELFGLVDYDPADPESYVRAKEALEELDRYLATLGPDALPTMAAILDAEEFFVNRRHLVAAIGNLGPQSEDATFILRDYFMSLVGDPRAGSELGHVIKAMGELKNDTSYDVLKDLITSEGVPGHQRSKLIVSLGEHPRREEAVPLLVDRMMAGEDSSTRNKAAQALGKIATPNLLPDLQNALERERYWVNKQTILGSMGKVGDPSSLPYLEDVARTATEREVRLSAAGAIRRIGTPRGRAILLDLSQTEPDAQVRQRILRWLEEEHGR